MTHELRILLVEDVAADAELIETELRKANLAFTAQRVETEPEFLGSLEQVVPDAVLADCSLTRFSALDALRLLRAREQHVPFLLVTGSQSEDVVVACLREGADDYIAKDRLARLATALQNALEKREAERKRRSAVAALHAGTQQFKLIAENTLDIICLVDQSGDILYVSPSCKQRLGYTPDEVRRGDATCQLPGGQPGTLAEGLRELLLGKGLRRAEFRCRHRNGTWRTLESTWRWIVEADGAKHRAVMVCRDVTRRRHSEALLKQANVALEKRERALVKALEELRRSHQELQAMHMQLIHAEKMESVGRLAAGVAHEVKNPLTVLMMGTEYLRRHLPDASEELHTVLGEMADSVTRANVVIGGLLDFSRPGMLELERHDLNSIIDQALVLVKHAATRSNIEIVRQLQPELLPLLVDRSKLEQAFVNLFTNAFHAMDDRGTLTVRTRTTRARDLDGRGSGRPPDQKAVVAEVEDTGMGIPPAKLTRIFDPFFTTKPTGAGTGLGLTVTRKIVELHGGSITVENRARGGVCARIVLWEGARDG